LKWNASVTPNVTYAVYRSPQSVVSYVQINTVPVTTLAYTDLTVTANTAYNYFVEAVLDGVGSAPSNIAPVTTPVLPSPASSLTTN
jgi:hypothetical protein